LSAINRTCAAEKFEHGSVQHFIASECDACTKAEPRKTLVVLVDGHGPRSVSLNGAAGTLTWEFRIERYGLAEPGPLPSQVSVEWGGRVHLFDRASGKCVESVDGLLRGWELHPFENTKNDAIKLNEYGERGGAPIERIPLTRIVATTNTGEKK
jgi:hypothetical protein